MANVFFIMFISGKTPRESVDWAHWGNTTSHPHRVCGTGRFTEHAETSSGHEISSQKGSSGGCNTCVSSIHLKLETIPNILIILNLFTYMFSNYFFAFHIVLPLRRRQVLANWFIWLSYDCYFLSQYQIILLVKQRWTVDYCVIEPASSRSVSQ